MKKFEIHITGESSDILDEFEKINLKTLTVDLMDTERNVVGTEYMCCVAMESESYDNVLEYTLGLTSTLKTKILRIKIESMYYDEFLDKAIYAEVHSSPPIDEQPTVYNTRSNKFVSTERTYDKSEFLKLKDKYNKTNSEYELCLYDSNKNFDDFWLSHY